MVGVGWCCCRLELRGGVDRDGVKPPWCLCLVQILPVYTALWHYPKAGALAVPAGDETPRTPRKPRKKCFCVFFFLCLVLWTCATRRTRPPPHIFSWYRNVLCGRLNSLFFPLSFCWCVLLSIFSPFSRFFFRLCFVRFVFLGGGLAKSRYT